MKEECDHCYHLTEAPNIVVPDGHVVQECCLCHQLMDLGDHYFVSIQPDGGFRVCRTEEEFPR